MSLTRFSQIMKEIKALNDEALDIVSQAIEHDTDLKGISNYHKAKRYWYNAIDLAIDKKDTFSLGGERLDMSDSLERMETPTPLERGFDEMGGPDDWEDE